MRRPPTDRPPPDEGALHAAALNYLARFAATESGLTRVLRGKVDRWARATGGQKEIVADQAVEARAAIAGIVARLSQSGAVSDAAFAQSRARSLARAGRSRRAIGAHLATKGVAGTLATAALPTDEDAELAAALIHARKRRIGPWRKVASTPETLRRELGSMARAGFAHGVSRGALATPQDEAEIRIQAFREAL